MSSMAEDLDQARRALDEAEERLPTLAPAEKVQAYLVIAQAWTEIARLAVALEVRA